MKTTDIDGIARRNQTIFFVVEAAGCLAGRHIGEINKVICNTVEFLSQRKNIDVTFKVAILEFNSKCQWLTPNGPQHIFNFKPSRLLEARGLAEIGAAITELDSKLSKDSFLKDCKTGLFSPIIFFISATSPTDDYIEALKKANNNKWFYEAKKFALTIDHDADYTMLANITGSKAFVMKAENYLIFTELIAFICSNCFTPNQHTGMAFPEDSKSLQAIHQFAEQLGISIATDEDVDIYYLLESLSPPVCCDIYPEDDIVVENIDCDYSEGEE